MELFLWCCLQETKCKMISALPQPIEDRRSQDIGAKALSLTPSFRLVTDFARFISIPRSSTVLFICLFLCSSNSHTTPFSAEMYLVTWFTKSSNWNKRLVSGKMSESAHSSRLASLTVSETMLSLSYCMMPLFWSVLISVGACRDVSTCLDLDKVVYHILNSSCKIIYWSSVLVHMSNYLEFMKAVSSTKFILDCLTLVGSMIFDYLTSVGYVQLDNDGQDGVFEEVLIALLVWNVFVVWKTDVKNYWIKWPYFHSKLKPKPSVPTVCLRWVSTDLALNFMGGGSPGTGAVAAE